MSDAVEIVMSAIRAVEERELEKLAQLYHPDVEFVWPPGLPYSGRFAGAALADMNARFASVWQPLQPDPETRSMSARAVAADESGDVVVSYMLRGRAPSGERFETETLARYQVRDGKFARAHMFYFDLVGLIGFLERAGYANAAVAAE